MQQSINPAKIDEGAVVGKVLDLSFNDDVFFNLIEGLSLLPALRSSRIALRDSTTFDRLRLSLITLASISRRRSGSVKIAQRAHIDLRAGQEGRNSIHVDAQAALDSFDYLAFNGKALVEGLLQIVPGSQSNCISARKNRKPSPLSMFFTSTSTSSPRLTVISPFSMNSFWLTRPSDL